MRAGSVMPTLAWPSVSSTTNLLFAVEGRRRFTAVASAEPTAVPEDLVQPGHVFPLQAKEGGVLSRAGQTEAARTYRELAREVIDLGSPPPGCPFHPRCPVAEERCRSVVPAWREIAPARGAACHLAQ